MTAKIGEFKGHKVLVLTDESNLKAVPFTFGYNKAKLILENLEEIKRFVELPLEEHNE
jgi:hypothetical protein